MESMIVLNTLLNGIAISRKLLSRLSGVSLYVRLYIDENGINCSEKSISTLYLEFSPKK